MCRARVQSVAGKTLRRGGLMCGMILVTRIAVIITVIIAASGCGLFKERPAEEKSPFDLVGKEMPPEQAKEVLSEVGENFAYGPGLGDTALAVGTVALFPPYAIYLLGNAVLSLSGYEPVTVSSLLPEEQGKAWSDTYDSVVSGPGKVVAAMAGHEYRSKEVGDERLRSVLERDYDDQKQ